LEDLKSKLAAEMAPLKERLESVRQAVQNEADTFRVALPARPATAIPDADESAWLFDASRDYLEQLAVYKARRGATL
jgi:hypothetical protein